MATTKKMDLLTAVEQIVERANGSKLGAEFYRKANKYIEYLSERLELTKEQSVMMALFIDNSDNVSTCIYNICLYLECRTTRIIRYMADIDVLEKRELIRVNRRGKQLTYRVPMEVIDAFKRNEKFEPKDCSGLSCQELFVEIAKTPISVFLNPPKRTCKLLGKLKIPALMPLKPSACILVTVN